jgi:hypothetical protein
MEYNKEEIIPGDIVTLDKEFQYSPLVKVVKIYPKDTFCRVHCVELENPTDEDCWDVMINRLTKI